MRRRAAGLALLAQAAAHGNPDAAREHALASRQVEARGRSDDDNLARAVDEHGLVDHAATIRALARPSVRLVAAPRDDATIPVGASKLGGAPDLPPGHAWPRRGARSLAFVAQLALDDLRRFAGTELLPPDGVLSFFYDAQDQPWGGADEADGWAVQHHPAATLVRQAGAAAGFAACAIDSFAELTLPPLRSALARSLGDEVSDRYGAAVETFQSVYRRPPRADGEIHRVLGHPDAIQGDMTRRIEYGWRGADLEKPEPTLELAARQWRLLLQVDSDHHAGMMWGDLGRLYFWIREDDLRARRWDAARLQLQCS